MHLCDTEELVWGFRLWPSHAKALVLSTEETSQKSRVTGRSPGGPVSAVRSTRIAIHWAKHPPS